MIAVKACQPMAYENWRSWKRQWQDRRATFVRWSPGSAFSIYTLENAKQCAYVICYTYTRVYVAHERDEKGDEGEGQRGVITDDCPLLRHGQSTARNPVHSPGSRGAMIRRRSAMRLDRAAAAMRKRRVCACACARVCVCACMRARARANVRLAKIGRGHANHSFGPAITRSIASRKRAFLEARGKRLPRYTAGNGG